MEMMMDQVKEQVSSAQELYEAGLEKGRELAKTASEQSSKAFGLADEWLHDNRWLALGAAVGVGLLLGILMASSGRNQSKQSE